MIEMDKKVLSLLVMGLILTSGISVLVNALSVNVNTDKEFYVPGEDVVISGVTDEDESVNIRVNDTLGLVFTKTIESDGSGDFSTVYHLPADALLGEYVVEAKVDSKKDQTTFTVVLAQARELAEKLIDMAQKARVRVEAAFEHLEDHNIDIPDPARDSYDQGLENEEHAQDLFDEDNYNEAVNEALQALQDFHTALRIVREVEGEEVEEEDTKLGRGPRVAIERAYRFLDRLSDMAKKLDDENYDVSEVKDNLEEAETHLEEATDLLDSGDVNGAAQELAEARGILGRTMALLHHIAKEFKIAKTEKFLENFEKRMGKLMDWISKKGYGLGQEEIASIMSSIRNAGMKLGLIRNRLHTGDVDEDIDEVLEELQKLGEEGNLNRRTVMAMFREMERAEARVRVLGESLEKLALRGADTSTLDEELQKAEELVAEIRSVLQSGNLDDATGLLQDADEMLDRLEDLITPSIRPNSGKGMGHGKKP